MAIVFSWTLILLLYLISGDETVAELLDGKRISISFITELELSGYKALSESDQKIIQKLLKEATVIDINAEVKRLVVLLRKNYRIKLPDAIVVASALYLDLPLVTASLMYQPLCPMFEPLQIARENFWHPRHTKEVLTEPDDV